MSRAARKIGLDQGRLFQRRAAQLSLVQVYRATLHVPELPAADRQVEIVEVGHDVCMLAAPRIPCAGTSAKFFYM